MENKEEEALGERRARPRERDRMLSADEMISILLRWTAGRTDPSP